MGKEVSYYSFADNDYLYLKANIEDDRVSNSMCSSAQNICERYLKAVVEEKAIEQEDTDIMRTHSLKRLRQFIIENIPDFECDWKTVVAADGYYFTARYPGEDAFFVNKDDVKECWEAVLETKRATDRFLEAQKEQEKVQESSEMMESHKKSIHSKMSR